MWLKHCVRLHVCKSASHDEPDMILCTGIENPFAHRRRFLELCSNDAWLTSAKTCSLNCIRVNYIIFPAEKLRLVYCAWRNQSKEKNVLRIHRCEHQIASISRLGEWMPRTPVGIQQYCFRSKDKTNVFLASKTVQQELKKDIPSLFHMQNHGLHTVLLQHCFSLKCFV